MTLDASVVVPTYRRLDRLVACLEALRVQTRPAHEVVVVVHVSDDASATRAGELAAEWAELRCVRVRAPGLVAALNCGLAAAVGDVVAFTDDDAVPSPMWLEQIVRAFELDEEVAAVGGRDVIVDGGVEAAVELPLLARRRDALEVGRIQWFGRMIANHHLGAGTARDVDVLKGVNMSFRRQAALRYGFDERLRGRGAIVHSELSVCLPLRREGLRIVYDPRILVTHYAAPRPYGDHRHSVDRTSAIAAAHNEALEILDYLTPARRCVFALWGVLIGTTGSPGVAIFVRETLARRRGAWPRFEAAQIGRAAAWRTRREPRIRPAAEADPAA